MQPVVVSGHVTIDGAPRAGVDLLLVADDGKPLAARKSQAEGLFELRPSLFQGGWVLARLHGDPFVGPVAVRVPAPARSVVVAVSSAAAVTLTLDFGPPPGVPFDWADVTLSPRAQPGVPDAVVHGAGWVDAGPSRLASYQQVRVTAPRASVRVAPGQWSVHVEHIVDQPRSLLHKPAPNWSSDVLTLPDGSKVPESLRAHRIEITRDLHVTLTTKVVTD